MDLSAKLASLAYGDGGGNNLEDTNGVNGRNDWPAYGARKVPRQFKEAGNSVKKFEDDDGESLRAKLTSIAYGDGGSNNFEDSGVNAIVSIRNRPSYDSRKVPRQFEEAGNNVKKFGDGESLRAKLTSIAYGNDNNVDRTNGAVDTATNDDATNKPTHSIKVPRLYKEAAKALKKVEEDGEGLKTVIHSMRHPNVKALTALVSEALRHASKLEVIMTKSKILKKEVGLAKQVHLVKILLTELLWGKKRLGGESKPVLTVTSYKEKIDKVLRKMENEAGAENTTTTSEPFVKKPRYVRVNTLKMELAGVLSHLLAKEWNQVSWEYAGELGQYDFAVDNFVDNLLVFAPGTEFHNHPLYLDGSFVLQDKASCLAAMALKPRKGRNVVDACAAPGMKTSHLAALTNNESPITAVEKSSKRFETLKTIVDSLGATNVTAINENFTDLKPDDYKDVEYILVDPSCSGSGMYSRLEIQLQAKEKNLDRILKLQCYQLKVLRHAMKFPSVKRIVYSTCSINPEENEDVIAEALKWINTYSSTARDNVGLAGVTWSFKLKRTLPDWPHRVVNDNYEWSDMCVRADESDLTDGFFVAVLERVK